MRSGRRGVRPAAEVGERAVAVERDAVDALLGDEVLDQLDLVVLVLGAEALERLARRVTSLRSKRLRRGDVLAHPRLDRREVGLGERHAVGEVEVVVEAVRRSAGRSRSSRPGTAPSPRSASTCAASWRIRSSASRPLLAVTISSGCAVGQRPREVAHLAGLTLTASAARARPGPIASAASAPVAPSGSSSGVPSGRVTFTGGDATRARCGARKRRVERLNAV